MMKLRTLAFDLRGDCLILVHTEEAPAPAEFDQYIAFGKREARRTRFTANIHSFRPNELTLTFTYLALSVGQQPSVIEVVNRLRQGLGLGRQA